VLAKYEILCSILLEAAKQVVKCELMVDRG
jgi:hypothetical protein